MEKVIWEPGDVTGDVEWCSSSPSPHQISSFPVAAAICLHDDELLNDTHHKQRQDIEEHCTNILEEHQTCAVQGENMNINDIPMEQDDINLGQEQNADIYWHPMRNEELCFLNDVSLLSRNTLCISKINVF